MKLYSCETHIDQVLEEFIQKEERFPTMKYLEKGEKLSTTCSQCKMQALYLVANG
ncbi:CxxH/CxxC protein [Sporosarcina ureilytica]|uniref:CxxH/CxxC protein n=1 Tax=Sporosarcina ureilytica TaxID=298596 RepID=UPI00094CAA23|nr:CxxH/CxxC protein [Sporosarcina ureilytica]